MSGHAGAGAKGTRAAPPPLPEAAWQRTVLDLAKLQGWLCYHTRDSRGSEPGFPDWVLVRDRVIFAELKSDAGKLRPAQRRWIGRLADAGAEAYVWRPRDWDEVKAALTWRVVGWKPPLIGNVETGGRL
jgi:hypothetical protein